MLLVLLFASGALLTGSRLAQFMDYVVGSSLGELKGMYAPDVTAIDKAHFDAEVKQLRERLRSGKVSMQNFQPFLKLMQTAVSDKKVNHEEVDRLTKAAHEASLKGTAKTSPVEEPPVRDHHPSGR